MTYTQRNFAAHPVAVKPVSLALQGGGSHGAFTWGVLDRLLEDGRIEINAISGASAGAMNAALLAYGLTVGGRDGARQALADFWEDVSRRMPFLSAAGHGASEFDIAAAAHSAALEHYILLTRFFSPQQLNPLDVNPLRELLADRIDFERLRRECGIELFIAATKVSTGTAKLFRTAELTLDMLLASACIPTFHRPVQIDGESYWDGGFSSNPPLLPLVRHTPTRDVILVLLNPCRRRDSPTTAAEIGHRMHEIALNSAVYSELHGLALAKREAGRSLFPFGRLERRLRRCNMHLIASEHVMSRLHSLSRLNTSSAFLSALRDEGRLQAGAWLDEHYRSVGSRSSFDLMSAVLR